MAKKLAMVFGVVFILVGLLGFFNNPILGIFAVNGAHNVVHLLIGIVMVIMASQGEASAAMSMNIFGVVYLLVAVLGFVMKSPMLGFIAYNGADNWLHVVLGIVLLAAGMSAKKSVPAAPAM